MIGRRNLPPDYLAWNQKWGAPNGRSGPTGVALRKVGTQRQGRRLLWRIPRLLGPFGFQLNSETRAFEYPWAYYTVPIVAGMTTVDVGGSLGGFQFVLAKEGARVTNVDPGQEATGLGWPVTASALAHLNAAFGTDVTLIPRRIEDAEIAEGSVDVVYSISTLEHIPADEIASTVQTIARILKPGGRFVLTVDLFLNLEPFCDRVENAFGTNLDIAALVEGSGMELVVGERRELCGFPEFDPRHILARLEDYLVGGYPAVAQALVLQK
jgi:2-polyprenyl-3-methyl-5-hydroxy-6-metoxy-1,4-benzoquinol methylase